MNCRGFRQHFKSWKSQSQPAGGAALEMHSDAWWFWSEEGRHLWKECKEKGEASPFWAEHHCAKRAKPAKGSKWWWWTSEGRAVWKECEEKGETSPFWKEHDCEARR